MDDDHQRLGSAEGAKVRYLASGSGECGLFARTGYSGLLPRGGSLRLR